jgi:hypothetical protein
MSKLGPTDKFPEGKINKDDEGEIQILVGREDDKGVVVINFGKPIVWVAFGPAQAKAIANLLIKHAEVLEKSEKLKQGLPN